MLGLAVVLFLLTLDLEISRPQGVALLLVNMTALLAVMAVVAVLKQLIGVIPSPMLLVKRARRMPFRLKVGEEMER